jgi:hypothetical protein
LIITLIEGTVARPLANLLMSYLKKLLPPCKTIGRLISQSFERKLPLGRRIIVRLHLRWCKACVRFLEQLTLLRNLVRQRADLLEDSRKSRRTPSLTNEAREQLERKIESRN